jgi:amidase
MSTRPNEDPTLSSLAALRGRIRTRTLSSRELLEAFVARIDTHAWLNAVITLDLERAYAQAAACDDDAARGRWRGPLHGLPCTIKDAFDTAGLRTTGGATEYTDRIPNTDAVAVAHLRNAGAIVFGKTNVPRWCADYETFNATFGTTVNPWDRQRTPGGSSGGAAAAVAMGLTAFELGSDIAGSIRVPASFCGIAGHKPSVGIIDERGYFAHPHGRTTPSTMNVVGPLARTVEDLQLLLDVLTAPPVDGWTVRLPAARQRPWRIAVHGLDGHLVDSDVRAAMTTAAHALAAGGDRVTADPPPVELDESRRLFDAFLHAGTCLASPDSDTRGGSHAEWLRAGIAREHLRERWNAWFGDHDALLMPTWPAPAFVHNQTEPLLERRIDVDGASTTIGAARGWITYAGIAGLPATVVRVGTSGTGLPIGVQIIGPYLGDRTCLAIARRLEQILGVVEPPPAAGRATDPAAPSIEMDH